MGTLIIKDPVGLWVFEVPYIIFTVISNTGSRYNYEL